MQRKPDRAQMAREHVERKRAHHAERLKEVRALAACRTGNLEAVLGRVLMPGEYPSTAPIGSFENIFGVEESQELTRPVRHEGDGGDPF